MSVSQTKGAVRPPGRPIAWVGADRLLLNDTTWYGLRRKVVACKDAVPNMVAWLQTAFEEARDAKVHWQLVEIGEFVYLWMIWKKEG